MVPLLILALAVASPNDAAHRADRATVRRLNRAAAHPPFGPATVAPADRRAYERASEAYRRELADWRSRVAACGAGQVEACR